MTSPPGTTLFALVAILAGCHPTPREETVIRRWLLCEECRGGELDSVVALRDNATGALGKALRGPPDSNRKHIRQQAEEIYKRLGSPQPLTLQQFVGHYDSNYVAGYQSHAAIALDRIGTTRARNILLQAFRNDSAYRDDAFRAIARATPISLSRVAGDLQSAPSDSFVRINPAVVVRDSTTGHPIPNVRVEFRVDSGGGRVVDSVQRTDSNGLASRPWRLGPGLDTVNVLRVVAAGRRVSFHATGHGLTPRLVFTVPPSNGTLGQPIAPVVAVAVLDAWGRRDTTFNVNAEVNVTGTGYVLIQPIIAGQAIIPGLVPNFAGTGFRLIVRAPGARTDTSRAFDVAP